MNSRVSSTQWVDYSAAAQIVAPGAIIVDDFQKEITDALRRNSVLDSRIEYVPATGDFSTYYEQLELFQSTLPRKERRERLWLLKKFQSTLPRKERPLLRFRARRRR